MQWSVVSLGVWCLSGSVFTPHTCSSEGVALFGGRAHVGRENVVESQEKEPLPGHGGSFGACVADPSQCTLHTTQQLDGSRAAMFIFLPHRTQVNPALAKDPSTNETDRLVWVIHLVSERPVRVTVHVSLTGCLGRAACVGARVGPWVYCIAPPHTCTI